MAMTTIPGGGVYLPAPIPALAAPAVASSISMSANNSKLGWVFAAPRTGNLAAVGWRTTAVGANGTLDLRLETVDDTTGTPSGTLVGANTNVALAITTGMANTLFTSTLTAAAAVTAGQLIAWVPTNPGASPANVSAAGLSLPGGNYNFPYLLQHNGASWTKIPSATPLLMVQYDDGIWYPVDGALPPATPITTTTFSTSSTPDVRGLRFQLPLAVRAIGAWVSMDLDGDCAVRLVTTAYNQGAGTGILATVTLDANVRGPSSGAIYYVTFNTPVDLSASTYYRLIVEPTTTTNLTVYDGAVASAAQLDAFAGGANFHLTTAKDPTGDGDWTNYDSGTFRNPYMGLQFDAVDVTGGGGGGGFTGGALGGYGAAGTLGVGGY
jgi:uncharacterized RmlC-like cupin family protein